MTKFGFDTQYYRTSQLVQLFKDCNSITLVNTGDNIVTVENIILYPGTPGTSVGDSFSIGGNEGEILDKRYLRVVFSIPGSIQQQIMITQKYFK